MNTNELFEMTESECLELAKKHGADFWGRPLHENMSENIIFENAKDLLSFTNAAIEQATADKALANTNPNAAEIQRLKIEIVMSNVEQRRALLAELTNDFRFCMYCGRPLVEAEGETK